MASAYYLTKREYEELNASESQLKYIKEECAYQNYNTNSIYSPLMLDLIDDENEMYLSDVESYPNDQVCGYTLAIIQKCMKGVTDVDEFESNIKNNKPKGVTDKQLNLLFQTFKGRWRKN